MRNVAPQRVLKENVPAVSQLVPATADFKALTSDHPEGVVTRFMQDRLEIVFWLKPPDAPGMIFGCLVSVDGADRSLARCPPGKRLAGLRARPVERQSAAGRHPATGRKGARLETAVCRLGNRRSAAALGSGALSHAPAAIAGKCAQRPPHAHASDRGRARRRSPLAAGRSSPTRAASWRSRKRKRISFPTFRTSSRRRSLRSGCSPR